MVAITSYLHSSSIFPFTVSTLLDVGDDNCYGCPCARKAPQYCGLYFQAKIPMNFYAATYVASFSESIYMPSLE